MADGLPQLETDREAGAVYLKLREGDVAETVTLDRPEVVVGTKPPELRDMVNVDIDEHGNVLGIEFIANVQPWEVSDG